MGKFSEALKKSGLPKADQVAKALDAMDNLVAEKVTDAGERTTEKAPPIDSVQPEISQGQGFPPVDAVEKGIETDGEGTSLARNRGKAEALQLDTSLVVHHAPHSIEAEQFRMLRTNILFPSNGKPSPRTILITSALPGEGKSFVSANLALSIAQNIDKRVLLMDCDMRRPTIAQLFGHRGSAGLSNYLLEGQPLQNLLLKTANSHLTILAGGPTPPNPAELLSSNRMAALLREVRSRYDDRYIIIDSPPPHLTAESKALAQFVDGIIVVVKFGHTQRDLVTDLVDKLDKQKILGVVANFVDQAASDFGADKYAGYSYYNSRQN